MTAICVHIHSLDRHIQRLFWHVGHFMGYILGDQRFDGFACQNQSEAKERGIALPIEEFVVFVTRARLQLRRNILYIYEKYGYLKLYYHRWKVRSSTTSLGRICTKLVRNFSRIYYFFGTRYCSRKASRIQECENVKVYPVHFHSCTAKARTSSINPVGLSSAEKWPALSRSVPSEATQSISAM